MNLLWIPIKWSQTLFLSMWNDTLREFKYLWTFKNTLRGWTKHGINLYGKGLKMGQLILGYMTLSFTATKFDEVFSGYQPHHTDTWCGW